jgi:hypothetical protein
MHRIKLEEGLMLQQKDADAMQDCLEKLPDKGCRLLEIGTGLGHSAKFFSQIKPEWFIYTIDSFGLCGDGRIYKEFNATESISKVYHYINGSNITQIVADSNKILWELPISALYLDGGHTYECVKKDFENFSSSVISEGYIFLHDYHRDDFGVKRLVDELVYSGKWELVFNWKVAIIKRK